VGGVEQVGEVVFTEALRFTFTSSVNHGAVDDARLVPAAIRDDPGQRESADTAAGDRDDRGGALPARAGLSEMPDSSAKRSTRPAGARSFAAGH
jgi:hypothetical protein